MQNKTKLRLRWGDFIVFAAIVAVACGIWVHLAMIQTDQTYGEIWLDGELYQQFRLDGSVQKTVQLEGRKTEVTIEIDGTQMRFTDSHCADHTCEQTGWISHVGQTAVCLPNRVMLKITGSTADAVDVIVQ